MLLKVAAIINPLWQHMDSALIKIMISIVQLYFSDRPYPLPPGHCTHTLLGSRTWLRLTNIPFQFQGPPTNQPPFFCHFQRSPSADSPASASSAAGQPAGPIWVCVAVWCSRGRCLVCTGLAAMQGLAVLAPPIDPSVYCQIRTDCLASDLHMPFTFTVRFQFCILHILLHST